MIKSTYPTMRFFGIQDILNYSVEMLVRPTTIGVVSSCVCPDIFLSNHVLVLLCVLYRSETP